MLAFSRTDYCMYRLMYLPIWLSVYQIKHWNLPSFQAVCLLWHALSKLVENASCYCCEGFFLVYWFLSKWLLMLCWFQWSCLLLVGWTRSDGIHLSHTLTSPSAPQTDCYITNAQGSSCTGACGVSVCVCAFVQLFLIPTQPAPKFIMSDCGSHFSTRRSSILFCTFAGPQSHCYFSLQWNNQESVKLRHRGWFIYRVQCWHFADMLILSKHSTD